MGKILDFIVGNSFVFFGVIVALLATLVAVVLSVKKSLIQRKIPIYEEIDENIELERAKEEDVIEKPAKRSKKVEAKEKEEVESKEEKNEKKSKKVENTTEKEDSEVKKKKTKKKEIEVERNEEFEEKEGPKKNKKIKNIQKELEIIFEEDDVLDRSEEKDELEETDEELIEEEFDSEVEYEFDDKSLREELEKIDDKEIEERIDEEHKKDIEDEINDNDNDELKEILEGMKDTNEVDPEEVVRNFEEEQEAQSIISYQELLSAVKGRDTDYEDELESRPLATVSDFIKNEKTSDIEPESNVLEMIEKIDRTKKETKEDFEEFEEIDETEIEETDETEFEKLEVINSEKEEEIDEKEEIVIEKEPLPEIPDEGRFKKTDVISPVFGRIDADKNIDYPKVEKFDRSQKKSDIIVEHSMKKTAQEQEKIKKERIAKEMQSVSSMFEDISSALEEKNKKSAGKRQLEDDEIESLSAISKNEDFLKALKDFRDSL